MEDIFNIRDYFFRVLKSYRVIEKDKHLYNDTFKTNEIIK